MGDFSPWQWIFGGDRTPETRVRRVLDHFGIDYWKTEPALRFVTDDEEVIETIQLALDGYEAELVETAGGAGPWKRYRVDLVAVDDA